MRITPASFPVPQQYMKSEHQHFQKRASPAPYLESRLIAALGVLMPAQIALAHISHTHGAHLFIGALILVCAVAIAITDHRKAPPCATMPRVVSLPLLAWSGFATLSLLWSLRPGASISRLASDVWMPLGCLFGAYYLGRAGQVRQTIIGLLAGLALIALTMVMTGTAVGIAAIAQGLPASLADSPLLRWFPGPGKASTMLVIMLPVLWWATRARIVGRATGVTAIAIAVACGAATQNRMFWGCLLAQFACVVAFRIHRRGVRRAMTKRLCLGACAVAALCGILLVTLLNLRAPNAAHGDDSLSRAASAIEQDPRRIIWRYWIDIGEKSPWIGTGFSKRTASAANEPDHPLYAPARLYRGWHPHNLLLSMWVQLGWVGAALFVASLAGLLYQSVRMARASSPDRIAGMVLFMLVVTLLAKNATDDFYDRELANVFFSLVGLLVGACLATGRSATELDQATIASNSRARTV
ncbi:O-antigen ligase family protein [Uliginosibacterium sp. sgz301328]|uniref:O-antigen ligase family protein n=1 Tax=Uliginosibacterium sp. sgz301328 TaxID=3243764 RepID=UPI00359DEC44